MSQLSLSSVLDFAYVGYILLTKIESSDIYGTSTLLNLLIYLIGGQAFYGKCLKCLLIQYWQPVVVRIMSDFEKLLSVVAICLDFKMALVRGSPNTPPVVAYHNIFSLIFNKVLL